MSTSVDVGSARTSSSRRSRPRAVARVLAGSYALFTAAAVLAWLLVGDAWWTVPVNITTFWWSLPSIGLVLLALALRCRDVALLLALPALLFVWAYGGLFIGSPAAVDGELRVASYNTFIQAPDLSHVVLLARESDPDVLLLQEVLPSQRDRLVELLGGDYPYRWFGEPGGIGGVGLMSRYPIRDVRPIERAGGASRPTGVVTLDVGGRDVQFVPVHLTSPCLRCGDSLVARQTFEAEIRRRETEAIIGALDPALPAVVGGDLNSTRRSDPYRLFDAAGFRDPQIEAGSGPGFTWPDGSGPFVRIDWVLARGLVPAASWVGPPRGSDHRPVIVDLAFPGPPGAGEAG